jgi:hypothetical protein
MMWSGEQEAICVSVCPRIRAYHVIMILHYELGNLVMVERLKGACATRHKLPMPRISWRRDCSFAPLLVSAA